MSRPSYCVRWKIFIRRKGKNYNLTDRSVIGNLDYFLPNGKSPHLLVGSEDKADLHIPAAANQHLRLQIAQQALFIEPLTEIFVAFEERRGMRRATGGKIHIPLIPDRVKKCQIKVADTHLLCQIEPMLAEDTTLWHDLLGRDDFMQKIGEGILADVFITADNPLNAFKRLRLQHVKRADIFEQFVRSGWKAQQCRHAGLVRTRKVHAQEQVGVVIEQEYIQGELLHNYIYRCKSLPLNMAIEILRQVAQMILYLGRAGIVHRDINPRNIIITPDHKVRLVGMSLLKCEETEALLDKQKVVGTYNYIAPEQIERPTQVDARADIFSLGALGYTMLAGFPPLRATNLQEYTQRLPDFQITPLKQVVDGLPPILDKFIQRCLCLKPRQRPGLKELSKMLSSLDFFTFEPEEAPPVWWLGRPKQNRAVSRKMLREELANAISIRSPRLEKRYQFVAILGHGGMGTVYAAIDRILQRKVAIKAVPKANAANVLKEARSAASFFHSNLIPVLDYFEGTADGQPQSFVVMEYMSGTDLAAAYEQRALPLPEAMRIINAILDGLDYLHQRNLVHRDIKPSNIFIAENKPPKLGDFGAVITAGSATAFFGTPEYASPEQFQQTEVDHRSDIYSLGATIYELVTRRLPFRGQGFMNFMSKHLLDTPQAPRELVSYIPESLNNTILKMLAKEPEKRFQNIEEVRQAWQAAEQDVQDLQQKQSKRRKARAIKLLQEAQYDCLMGQWEQGVQKYEQALQLQPQNPELHSALGDALYAWGDHEKAQDMYRQANKIDPAQPLYLQKLGDICEKEGETEEALHHYALAAQRDPYNNNLQLSLGYFYDVLGEHDVALLKAQNLALKQLPRDHPVAVYFRDNILSEEDHHENTPKEMRLLIKNKDCQGLLNCFYSIDWEIRIEAAKVIGQLQLADAIGGLLTTLGTEPDEEVRAEIFKTIGKLADPGAIPGLVQAFLNESQQLQTVIAEVLVQFGEPALQALLQALPKAPVDKQTDIMLTIGRSKMRHFVPQIIPYLHAPDPEVGRLAAKALGMLGGWQAYWTLRKISWNFLVDRRVRQAAARAASRCFK